MSMRAQELRYLDILKRDFEEGLLEGVEEGPSCIRRSVGRSVDEPVGFPS